MASSQTVLSGIQTSGQLHLGNYLGALRQFIALQGSHQCYFFLADLHAATVPQEPEQLRRNIRHVAAVYLACGLDPEQTVLFRQSAISEHAELGWLLTTLTSMGELSRMTQFKDKSGKAAADSIGAGLFSYPSLMAADILLYQPQLVPVGEDQKQHLELARTLAERFNHRFGQTFTVPKPLISKEAARVMGLDDPTKKMSKSAASEYNYIALSDSAETIRRKIKKAVTDSGSEVIPGKLGPALRNLATILALLTDRSLEEVVQKHAGERYGAFKEAVAEQVVSSLAPIRTKLTTLENDPAAVDAVLDAGADKARPVAARTLQQAKSAMGL